MVVADTLFCCEGITCDCPIGFVPSKATEKIGSCDSDLEGLQHIQITGLLRSEDFRGTTDLIGFVGGAGAKRSQLVKVAM